MTAGAERPIGVFDSGIGGLTVMHALMERLPRESLIYFGDTARVPYGPKSRETVSRFSIENVRLLTAYDVKAVVVAKPGTSVEESDIIAWARERIAPFKAPRSVDVIDALPRNASGKILRKDLRAPYWEGYERMVN